MCIQVLYLSADSYTYQGCILLQAGGLKGLCVLAVRAGLTSGLRTLLGALEALQPWRMPSGLKVRLHHIEPGIRCRPLLTHSVRRSEPEALVCACHDVRLVVSMQVDGRVQADLLPGNSLIGKAVEQHS